MAIKDFLKKISLAVSIVLYPFNLSFSFMDDKIQNSKAQATDLSLVSQNFRLLDQHGNSWSLSDYASYKNLTIIPYIDSCPTNGIKFKILEKLESYSSKDFKFIGISPKTVDDRLLLSDQLQNLKIPILLDYASFALKRLNIFESSQMHSFSFKNYKIAQSYTDTKFPEMAFEKENNIKVHVLNFVLQTIASLDSVFPSCNFSEKLKTLHSFEIGSTEESVYSLAFKNCVICHLGSNSYNIFSSIADFRNWRAMSLRQMETMRMPPMGIDYSHSTTDIFSLFNEIMYPKASDLRKIYSWIDAGAPGPHDSKSDPIADLIENYRPFSYASQIDNSWSVLKLRTPKTDKISASAGAVWTSHQLFGPTQNDLYVKGFRIKTDYNVAHHVSVAYITKPLKDWKYVATDFANILQLQMRNTKSELILTNFTRGEEYEILPKSHYYLVPKGAYIVLQVHYTSTGKPETVTHELELYHTAKSEIRNQKELKRMYCPQDNNFIIPAFEQTVKYSCILTSPKDLKIMRIGLHGHYRLKAYRVYLQDKSNKKTLLLNVPFYQVNYNAGWRFLKEQILLKGEKLIAEFIYDNSLTNSANPDPAKTVRFGSSTIESEMANFRVHYVEM